MSQNLDLKSTNWVKLGFKWMKGNQENIKEVENTEKDVELKVVWENWKQ